MTSAERLDYLIKTLLSENEEYAHIAIPASVAGRRRLLEVQGDYGLMQCARGCHDTLYDDRKTRMQSA